MTKLLFVCTANIDRSPTGEGLFKDQPGFEVKSAGTKKEFTSNLVSKEVIEWADIIFCMEEHHRNTILTISPRSVSKTVVLDIPDIYHRGDLRLVKLMKDKVSKYLKMANFEL